MNKVYCINCKNFEENYLGDWDFDYTCKSPNNTKAKNTWKTIIYSYPLKPKKINKNNDCPWYDQKDTVVIKVKKDFIDPDPRTRRKKIPGW